MIEELIKVLDAASGEQVEFVKQAEAQLKLWDDEPGFYTSLLDIFFVKELKINIRWMAIICFKNGIVRQWKRTGEGALTELEKQSIRGKLIVSYSEEISQLATQLAVVIGKLARIDIKNWPESIQRTIEAVKLDDLLCKHRALLTLNQIIKQLASKRLITDRKIFQEISLNIFEHLYTWSNKYYAMASNIKDDLVDMGVIVKSFDMLMLVTKITSKLIIHGPKEFDINSMQNKYIESSIRHIHSMLLLKKEYSNNHELQEKISKIVIIELKMLSQIQETRPLSFVPFIEEVLKFCIEQILIHDNKTQIPMLIIYCSNLLRAIIRSYKNPKSENPNPVMNSAVSMKEKILSSDFVKHLCCNIIFSYFPLTPDEISNCLNDQEDYVIAEAGESYKFLLRPCMEALYLSLFYEYKSIIIPLILSFLRETNELYLKEIDDHNILKLSAIYKSVGLASYEIGDDLDFDSWFENNLMHLMGITGTYSSILRQHIIALIGDWINVKFSQSNRLKLYNILCSILKSDEVDTILKLTCCKTLRSAIDDFDFNIDDFEPFVNDIFIALCQLLMALDLCDTKLLVLNVISIMVERVSDKIKENAQMLLHYLPQLWTISSDHNLLRGGVVNVLGHLVKGLGNDSERFSHITLPIIEYSTSLHQDAHIYLLEDGLELWQAVLQNAHTITDGLLKIYRNIPSLLECASENLNMALSITKLYLLLDASIFLTEYGSILNRIFHELFGNIRDDAAIKITNVVKLSIQLEPELSTGIYAGYISKVIGAIILDENYAPLMIQYLLIIGYILLYQPMGFQNLVHMHGLTNQMGSFEDVMDSILTVWLNKNDFMASIIDKKISAIVLSSLLPHKASFITKRFGLIVDFCVNVMYDLQKKNVASEDEVITDSLVVSFADLSDDGEESAACLKEHKALMNEPVYNITLTDYVREKLQKTQEVYGHAVFQEALATLDSAVAAQLTSLIQ